MTQPNTKAMRSLSLVKRRRQQFSSQAGGQRKNTLQELDAALWQLSGGDVASMLQTYLFERREGKKHCQKLNNIEQQKKVKQLMSGLKNLIAKTPEKDRPQYLSVASSVFTHEQLRTNFDINCSKKSFQKSRKHAKVNGAGSPIKTKTKTPLSDTTQQIIREFFYDDRISREAANRTKKVKEENGKKIPVPVRYLQCYPSEAFKEYLKNPSNPPVSYSSFKKYKPVEVIKAKRDTDLCAICKEGKVLENRLKSLLAKSSRTSEEETYLKELKENVKLYHQHRDLEETIRNIYRECKNNLKVGDAIIIMDFKENVALGKSQQETNRDFYDTPQRSIFCIAVLYKTHASSKVHTKYFDFISECLAHDTTFVSSTMSTLFDSYEWKTLQIKKDIHLWMDNGPQHFRTFEFLDSFAKFSKRFSPQKFTLNYFVEYHGKCICDSHFSLLSRYYRDYSKFYQFRDPIYTTEDYITLLETAIANANDSPTRKRNTPELNVKFFIYHREQNPVSISQIRAHGFGSYYFFQTNNAHTQLQAKLHSNHSIIHNFKLQSKQKQLQEKPVKKGWAGSQAKPLTMNTIDRKNKTRSKHAESDSPTKPQSKPSPHTPVQTSADSLPAKTPPKKSSPQSQPNSDPQTNAPVKRKPIPSKKLPPLSQPNPDPQTNTQVKRKPGRPKIYHQ